MHFTEFYNLNIKGHEDINFIDISLKTDTKLFIDPFLIESLKNPLAERCTFAINSFFEVVFECCKNRDDDRLRSLLDFGHEPNETKLGLSRKQSSGKGASSEILYSIFKQISNKNLLSDGLIKKPQDLCLFVGNFAEDRMSDLITNIIRKELYRFTEVQCLKLGIPLSKIKKPLGNYWDSAVRCWKSLDEYPLEVESHMLLLVPKNFVSNKYIYSIKEYIQHKILEERQIYHQKEQTVLAKAKWDASGNVYYDKPSKKTVYNNEIKGTPHKNYAEKYSRENPKSLVDFRQLMARKLLLAEFQLTDEVLDDIVYKKTSKAS